MGTYNIPRKMKGESRILVIFSVKGLIYTLVGGLIGLIFFFILKSLGFMTAGIIVLAIFALVSFAIGTFKIPDNNSMPLFTKVGGENIDDIIKRFILFKLKNNKIYINEGEEENNAK